MASEDKQLTVQGIPVHLNRKGEEDYISLTDMTAKFEGGTPLIDAWLRNKDTVEFLGVWERLNNPGFNSVEFDGIREEAGVNRFVMSAKRWRDRTAGIGLIAKTGRYGGGVHAHSPIASSGASSARHCTCSLTKGSSSSRSMVHLSAQIKSFSSHGR